jgi:hypothetical protein
LVSRQTALPPPDADVAQRMYQRRLALLTALSTVINQGVERAHRDDIEWRTRYDDVRRVPLKESEMRMMTIVLAAAITSGFAARAAETQGSRMCLDATHVSSTSVLDNRTILFHMGDGRVWKNTLKRECTQLKFEGGFEEDIRGGEICANAQIIRVLQTGLPCQLGDFSLYSAPKR